MASTIQKHLSHPPTFPHCRLLEGGGKSLSREKPSDEDRIAVLDRSLGLINLSIQLYDAQQEAGGAVKSVLNPMGGGGK